MTIKQLNLVLFLILVGLFTQKNIVQSTCTIDSQKCALGATCVSQPDNCSACKGTYFKEVPTDSHSTCLVQCPHGFFGNAANNECEPCDSVKCYRDAYCQHQADRCSQCNTGYVKEDDGSFAVCVQNCPYDKFPYDNDYCRNCNPTICEVFTDRYTCDELSSKCHKCKTQYKRSDNEFDFCIANCPNDQYQNESEKQCQQCDVTCDATIDTGSQKVCQGAPNLCKKCSQAGGSLFRQDPDTDFSECKADCPNTHFEDRATMKCRECDLNICTTVTGQICSESSIKCAQCKGIYYKENESSFATCVEDCPQDRFKLTQPDNNICQACHDDCETTGIPANKQACQQPGNKCFKCKAGKFKQNNSNEYDECQAECPKDSFKDPSNNECVVCDQNRCNTNLSDSDQNICENEAHNCHKCKDTFYKQNQLSEFSHCESTCPQQKYLRTQEGDNTCNLCDSSCDRAAVLTGGLTQSCASPGNLCFKCFQSGSVKLFKQDSSQDYSECLPNCPNDKFSLEEVSNFRCQQCDTNKCAIPLSGNTCKDEEDNCRQCKNDYYKQVPGDDYSKCLMTCPLDTFQKQSVNNNICQKCDASCDHTIGGGREVCRSPGDKCFKCSGSLLKLTDEEYAECSNQCPNDQFENDIDDKCEDCDAVRCSLTFTTKMCNQEANNCLACRDGYFKQNPNDQFSLCEDSCPIHTVEDDTNNQCIQCSDDCDNNSDGRSNCEGQPNLCYKCKPNYFKQDPDQDYSECQTECPNDRYKDSASGQCLECSQDKCNLGLGLNACRDSADNCMQCKGIYYKQDQNEQYSQCLETCPGDFYKHTQVGNNVCVGCSVTCEVGGLPVGQKVCSSPGDLCFKCSQSGGDDLFKQNESEEFSKCLKTCPLSKYKVQNGGDYTCEPCDNAKCNVALNNGLASCETQSHNCQVCIGTHYKQDPLAQYSECLENCPLGTYKTTIDSQNLCQDCHEACDDQGIPNDKQVCNSDPIMCYKCKEGYFKQNPSDEYSECTRECGIEYFQENRECKLCSVDKCDTTLTTAFCEDSEDNCARCKGIYYKQDPGEQFSQCLETCPDGRFQHTESNNNQCLQCSHTCGATSGGQDQCISPGDQCFVCSQTTGTELFKQDHTQQYSECLAECPEQKFQQRNDFTCQECSQTHCNTNLGLPGKSICQDQSNQCFRCKGIYYKQNPLDEYSECLETCPQDRFQFTVEEGNNICQKCSDTCSNTPNVGFSVCGSQDDKCNVCSQTTGQSLYKQNPDDDYSECLPTCDHQRFKNDVTFTCDLCDDEKCDTSLVGQQICQDSESNCKKCRDNFFKENPSSEFSECVAECSNNLYQDENDNSCKECDQSCSDTVVGDNSLCIHPGNLCFNCKNTSTIQYFKQDPSTPYSECKQECPLDSFKNTVDSICEKCDVDKCITDLPGEKICEEQAHKCKKCKGDYYKQDPLAEFSECLDSCPPGKLKIVENNESKCMDCHEDCETSGIPVDKQVCLDEIQHCHICSQAGSAPLYKKEPENDYSECVEECPMDRYKDDLDFTCKLCNENICNMDIQEKICIEENYKCKKCKGMYYKTNPEDQFSDCSMQCPTDTLKKDQPGDNICEKCDEKCNNRLFGEIICVGEKDNCKECKRSLDGKNIYRLIEEGNTSEYAKCVFDCPMGYYKENVSYQCRKCNEERCNFRVDGEVCIENNINCQKCIGDYFKQESEQIFSECQNTCPSDKQKIVSPELGNICESCDITCDLNELPTDMTGCKLDKYHCLKCSQSQGVALFKQSEQEYDVCVEDCPLERYKNTEDFICEKCDLDVCDSTVEGEICQEKSIQCQKCRNGYYKQDPQQQYSECKDSCPDGFYLDDENNECKECDISCKVDELQDDEVGCIQPGNLCLFCKDEYHRESDDEYSICLDSCPLDHFQDENRVCQECDLDKCTSNLVDEKLCQEKEDKCKQCKGEYFKQDSTLSYSECKDSCPAEKFGLIQEGNNICVLCNQNVCASDIEEGNMCQDSATKCQQCKGHYYKQDPNEQYSDCKTTCPAKFYMDSETNNNTCQPCHDSCDRCDGPDADDCTECEDGKILSPDRDACVDNCDGYVGTYPNYDTKRCEQCHELCTSCFGNRSSQCFSCVPTAIKVQNDEDYQGRSTYSCLVDDCRDGSYKSPEDGKCKPCSDECKTCKGDNDHCLSCEDDFVHHGFRCLNQCPDGTYEKQKKCYKCYHLCATCDGPASTQCKSCNPDYFGLIRVGSECMCMVDYYLDKSNKKCLPYIKYDITMENGEGKAPMPVIKITFEEKLKEIPQSVTKNINIKIEGLEGDESVQISQNQIESRLLNEDDDDEQLDFENFLIGLTNQEIKIKSNILNSVQQTTLTIFTDFKNLKSVKGVPIKEFSQSQKFDFSINSVDLIERNLDLGNDLQKRGDDLLESDFVRWLVKLGFFVLLFNALSLGFIVIFIKIMLPFQYYNFLRVISLLIFEECAKFNETLDKDFEDKYDMADEQFQRFGLYGNFLKNGYIVASMVVFFWMVFLSMKFTHVYRKKQQQDKQEELQKYQENDQYQSQIKDDDTNKNWLEKGYLISYRTVAYVLEHFMIYFFIYGFLQIQNASFNSFYNALSFIAAIGFIGLYIFCTFVAGKQFNQEKNIENRQKVFAFYGGLINNIKYSDCKQQLDDSALVRNYHLVNLGKKLLISAILVFFYKYPKFQLISILVILLAQLAYTLAIRPYRSLLVNIVKALADLCISLTIIFAIILIYLNDEIYSEIRLDHDKLDKQYLYGTYMFWFTLLFLVFHAIISTFEFLISFFRFIFRDKNLKDMSQINNSNQNLNESQNNNGPFKKKKSTPIQELQEQLRVNEDLFRIDTSEGSSNRTSSSQFSSYTSESKFQSESIDNSLKDSFRAFSPTNNSKLSIEMSEQKLQKEEPDQIQQNSGYKEVSAQKLDIYQDSDQKLNPTQSVLLRENQNIQNPFPPIQQKLMVINKYVYKLEYYDNLERSTSKRGGSTQNSSDSEYISEDLSVLNGKRISVTGSELVSAKVNLLPNESGKYDIFPQYKEVETYYLTQNALQNVSEVFQNMGIKDQTIHIEKEQRINLEYREIDLSSREIIFVKDDMQNVYFQVKLGKRYKYTGNLLF